MTRDSPSRRAWLFAITFGIVAYGIHKTGVILGWYYEFFWFQILTHFLSATAMALLLLMAGRQLRLSSTGLVAFVLVGSAIGALSWELIEYFDVVPWLIWWGIEDSLLDLTADAVGVAMVLLFHRLRFRLGGGTVTDSTVADPSLTSGD